MAGSARWPAKSRMLKGIPIVCIPPMGKSRNCSPSSHRPPRPSMNDGVEMPRNATPVSVKSSLEYCRRAEPDGSALHDSVTWMNEVLRADEPGLSRLVIVAHARAGRVDEVRNPVVDHPVAGAGPEVDVRLLDCVDSADVLQILDLLGRI